MPEQFKVDVDHGIAPDEIEVPEDNPVEPTIDEKKEAEERAYASQLLNIIGEDGDVLNYITDEKDKARVKELLQEKLSTTSETLERRREIAEEIYKIADEAYDRLNGK